MEKNHITKVISGDPRQAQTVRNLNIFVPRVQAIGKRWGHKPCRALFVLKDDKQVLDDLVYPLGIPVSRPAWWYGKAAQQSRSRDSGGHVFEFATVSDPAHVVLGETNDLIMHIHVIVHAWMGHVHLFTNNRWHRETEQKTALQRFAQDEQFVRGLVADPRWGWDRYEYYADAAHALEHHSGELPTPITPTDEELREALQRKMEQLEAAFTLATTEPDREAIAADIRDTAKLLSCHPIQPTTDLLGFLLDPDNTKHLTDEARRIIEITRFENRYSTQVVGRTKILYEGLSHFVDRRMPHEPELDLIRLGMGRMIDTAYYDTMHDAWPIYIYSDPYDLGESIIEYIDDTHSRVVGEQTVKVRRIKVLGDADIAAGGEYALAVPHVTLKDEELDGAEERFPAPEYSIVGNQVYKYEVRQIADGDFIDGDIVETTEVNDVKVPVWDRSYLLEVAEHFDDMRLFHTFLTEDFFEKLHKKSLKWVKKMIMLINGKLKQVHWDPNFIFEGDRFPQTLQEMFEVCQIWMNQLQMSGWVGMYFGYGAPQFPVSQTTLYQMLQIIQTVASYDQDKRQFKRQMLLRTGLQWLPNIKLVDTGRYNNAAMFTLRHEYDPDFGPLQQEYARQTMRYYWRLVGKVRLLTMEILTDSFGRPWGPPRPYQYSCDNGKTVKERWISG
jgi:spore cortex formation protein SpoVR/YcgB (stage V sporulation)